MKTFREYLTELSHNVLSSYHDKALRDVMHQLLKKGNKRKAAKRAKGATKAKNKIETKH
jgi:hypothetical protein